MTRTAPTMWLQGLWDQEDMWGAIHSWRAIEPKDKNNDLNYNTAENHWDRFKKWPLSCESDCASKSKPNIFDAKPGDYQKATQKIWAAPGTASFVSLPVVE